MKSLNNCFIALILTISTLFSYGQQTQKPSFDFEQRSYDGIPQGWFFQQNPAYKVSIDTIIKHGGNASLKIESLEDATGFIAVMAIVPGDYVGNKVELNAYLKLESVENPIGLMLRIDGDDGILQFDNMQPKGIKGTEDWIKYTVELPLPEEARNIYIGVILQGKGILWADDISVNFIPGKSKNKKQAIVLPVVSDNIEFAKGSKINISTLNPTQLKNLDDLGKIWGFLKYYHPYIAKGNYNWDYELFRIIPQIIDVSDMATRDKILTKWISSLGKFKHVENGELFDQSQGIKVYPDLAWIENSGFSQKLTHILLDVKQAKRLEKNYYAFWGKSKPIFKEELYLTMDYSDAGYRILSLYRYWNIIQYYFPYKYLIEEDWKDVLTEFIPKIIQANNEKDYTFTLLELIARIHDTHANIWGGTEKRLLIKGKNVVPIEDIDFIENKLIVTALGDKETEFKLGDIITKVNNEPVESIVARLLKITPASNHETKLRDIAGNILRTHDTVVQIEYMRDGLVYNTILSTFEDKNVKIRNKYYATDTCFRLIDSNIAYFYPGTYRNSYMEDLWNHTKNTDGLIIDLRCYPSEPIIHTFSNYFMPDAVDFVKFTYPNMTYPGLFSYTQSIKTGKKNDDYYKGKIAILINEYSQSQSEFSTMAFQKVPNAIVIGSTTAASDGDLAVFVLPGGIYTSISSLGVYYPDGTETQRIGIIPDIEAKPTIEGVKTGKDEVLEKAIEWIKKP